MPLIRTPIIQFVLITATLSLGFFSTAHAENWVVAYEDDYQTIEVDQDRLTRHDGSMVHFYYKVDDIGGEYSGDTTADCQNRLLPKKDGPWVSPDDNWMSVVNHVCKP